MRGILRGNNKGFSLVELLVVMALTFVASIMIYKSYQTFSTTTSTQEEYMELNQNLRIGLDTMIRELRMAGYRDADPKRRPPGGVGFVMATADTVQFTMDYTGGGDDGFDNDKDGSVDEADEAPDSDGVDNDGDGIIDNEFPYSDGRIGATLSNPLPGNGEDVTYALSTVADANGSFRLTRTDNTSAAGAQTLIENVDALNFVYYDNTGTVIATPVQASRLDDIREVEVTVVVRSSNMDPDVNDTTAYANSQGDNIYQATGSDRRYRRRLLAARVKCRNMGLR